MGTVALRGSRHLEGPPPRPPRAGLSPGPGGPRLSETGRFCLRTAGILVALGSLGAVAQLPLWTQAPALAVVNLSTSLTLILTGLLLHREPGQRGVAWALILAGVCRPLDFIDAWTGGPWPAYAVLFGGIDRVFGAWAVLRYPRPRLTGPQRVYVAVLAGWMLTARTMVVLTSTAQSNGYAPTSWWPSLVSDLRLSDTLSAIDNGGEGFLAITLLVLLVLRLVRTKGLDRIVIAPIIAAGIAAVIAASATAIAQIFATSISVGATGAYVAEGLVDVTLPLAFLVAVVQRGLLARNLAGLSARISAGADLGSVRYALRETLHDPTLEVLDVSDSDVPASLGGGTPGGRGGGRPGAVETLPAARADSRLVEVIRTDAGAPIAVVIADPALARYRGLFDAAVRTSGLALKNAQLQAQAARAELNLVRASRARIVEAAVAERRRLERDLHDGAQQHLLGLAARLTAAMARTTDPEATAAFQQARAELGEVLAELRDLAHGIHPASLMQGGLAAALEEIAERLPLAIDLSIAPARVAPAVEATAYFVACEALTNAVKHAQANLATVAVRISAAELEMDITDDGIGGADPAGSGLGNMTDRVSALNGSTIIDSPPGNGTRIVVSIPCA
ncbi:MAG TPA: sensor histidine kinase [Pseudonocardiaceae bacterium]|nr:sensor histidine kinase [Pseudonocardiaceae bacterium]